MQQKPRPPLETPWAKIPLGTWPPSRVDLQFEDVLVSFSKYTGVIAHFKKGLNQIIAHFPWSNHFMALCDACMTVLSPSPQFWKQWHPICQGELGQWPITTTTVDCIHTLHSLLFTHFSHVEGNVVMHTHEIRYCDLLLFGIRMCVQAWKTIWYHLMHVYGGLK